MLSELENETRTIIIYEAPHRLIKTLTELEAHLGGDRKVAVCKELTKKHETVYRNTLQNAIEYYENNEPRGEYVIVIEGKSRQEIIKEEQDAWKEMSVEEHLEFYINKGTDSN